MQCKAKNCTKPASYIFKRDPYCKDHYKALACVDNPNVPNYHKR